ncbi:MAG TPA: hypothetical protein VHW01_06265 [Polyangiaceae bacterium]|nr:hypothetical protein [Polyangiaceae bacterium]
MTTTLAVAGCGSSAKTLTRAQLTSEANEICHRVNVKLDATNHQVKTPQDLARLAPQLVSFEQGALAELSKLSPPSELADDWKEILADAQTLADNTAKLGEYAKSKQTNATRELIQTSEQVQLKMIATAKRDGLTDCEKTV